MAIRIETGPGQRCRAIVDGSMTIYEAAADKPVLLDALARARQTDVDLSSVREMDTAGLQILILAKRESLKAGTVLRVTAHSPASLDVVERYGLAAYFGDGSPGSAGSRERTHAALRSAKRRRAAKAPKRRSG
jgi:anti-anti-sigma regulatory factor